MSSAIPFELSRPSTRPGRAKTNSVHLGSAGEAWCAQQHQLARKYGLARIEKLNPPTVGPNGHMRFAKKSNVDFGGYLLKGGRAVLCECKSFAGDRLALSAVKDHQREQLGAAHDAGAVALLLLIELAQDAQGNALPLMRAAYAVPWWRARLALGAGDRGSLLVRDVAQHRVASGALYLDPWGSR